MNVSKRNEINISSAEESDENEASAVGDVTPHPSGSKRAKLVKSPTLEAGSTANQRQMDLVNKCVLYLLVADQKKQAIRKADIIKHIFEDQNDKDTYINVLKGANNILKKTFGLELLALKNQNNYILVNILDPNSEIKELAEDNEIESQKRGLTFLLLTLIFMNENSISDDKVWKSLEALGLNPNSGLHPVFGNVKKFVTVDLVKEMYVEYTRVNKDPVQFEFTWGERAYQEVRKKDLLEFACSIYGDCKPEDWKLQFMDATKG